MDKQIEGKKMHITINVLMTVVMIVLVVLSTILFGHEDENRYALRVITRGVLGILLIYDALYLLLTDKWSFLSMKASRKQRLFGGVLIGIVGFGCVITTFLGYGINGDPLYFFMK